MAVPSPGTNKTPGIAMAVPMQLVQKEFLAGPVAVSVSISTPSGMVTNPLTADLDAGNFQIINLKNLLFQAGLIVLREDGSADFALAGGGGAGITISAAAVLNIGGSISLEPDGTATFAAGKIVIALNGSINISDGSGTILLQTDGTPSEFEKGINMGSGKLKVTPTEITTDGDSGGSGPVNVVVTPTLTFNNGLFISAS